MENQMKVSVSSTSSNVEMHALYSKMKSEDHDLAEVIAGQNKSITNTRFETANRNNKMLSVK